MFKLSPQVNTALILLEQAGFEGFLVGGAVRDLVMGAGAAKDWDIATDARPEQVEQVFAGYRVIETGVRHGTVTVLLDGEPMEITTYRVDGAYSDHRRPDSVCFTRSLREDLERRDFTMNALAFHPRTGVVDLVGGVADIRAGMIRCVGDPDRRFREDGLRILRAIRFASVLGMEIEEQTTEAIHSNRELLTEIAPERIRAELTKLLCGTHAAAVLREFADVVAVPLPEIVPMFGFEQHNPHHDKCVWEHTAAVVDAAPLDPALRWAALLHDIGKPACFSRGEDGVGHFYGHGEESTRLADGILRRLRFDTAGRERIVTLVRYHDLPITAERRQLRRLLNKLGEDALRQVIELHRADTMGLAAAYHDRLEIFQCAEEILDELLREGACFSMRDLAVNGDDMLELGLSGRAVGQALEECLTAVLEERLPNRREELLNYLSGR